jgi:hypothetical protein
MMPPSNNFSVERMAAGGACLQVRELGHPRSAEYLRARKNQILISFCGE